MSRRTAPWDRLISLLLALILHATVGSARPDESASGADSDSAYAARHPRLLFSRDEIPALRAKVLDGGADDRAYAYIHQLVDSLYPASPLNDLMGQTYGMHFLLNIGIVSHVDSPPNAAAIELGRALTLAVADSLAPDDNVFYSPVRLRILTLGYDTCMDRATPEERAYVRGEIESYMDSIMTVFNYERWLYRPYVSNISAMVGSALGLAAICLSDELPPQQVAAALARADTFIATWQRFQLDPDGAYKEGVQYAAWSMHHLAAYFEARRRYDGRDHSLDPAIRGIERWIAYELLPESGGAVNNLNDTAYLNRPLSRHNTYLDWAMSAWSSGLAAWLWERVVGTYGYDWGLNVDHAATILWWRPLSRVSPAGSLPRAFLWKSRGLYYYRTGWPPDGASDDVVFSFYSGKFQGGHSQEDQNSFTLYGFGARFAADNGFDSPNWVSRAHNMIFIDDKGQHHSGGSTGTDGAIAGYLLGDYCDYVFGDATSAYTTHSPFNNPGYPFPDSDWSAGYTGANPVQYAHRRWLIVHQGATPPYFVLLDDIKKDALTHTYDWRMHTDATYDIDLTTTPLRVAATRGALEIDLLSPAPLDVAMRTEPFANPSADPDTRVVVLSRVADAGRFALVLRPTAAGSAQPIVTPSTTPWGGFEIIQWHSGPTDLIVANPDRDSVSMTPSTLPAVATDARLAQLRFADGLVDRYALVDATQCDVGEIPVARVDDEPLSIIYEGGVVHIDRESAAFRLYAPRAAEIRFRESALPFDRDGDFVRRGSDTPARAPRSLRVYAYPVPFHQGLTVVVEARSSTLGTVEVYDVRGARVRQAWTGMLAGGRTFVSWDGKDDAGRGVPSGVYFLRATTDGRAVSAKIVRVR